MGTVQEILCSAAHVQPGLMRSFGVLFHQPVGIHFRSFDVGRVSENSVCRAILAVPLYHSGNIHGAAEAGSRGETLRIRQRQAHRSITAHAQPGHKSVFRLVAEAKETMHRFRQFLAYIIPIPLSVNLIAIEAVIDCRHDYSEIVGGGIPFHRGSAHPDGVVIAVSMQKVQHLGQRFFLLCLDTDSLVCFRQNHVYGGGDV